MADDDLWKPPQKLNFGQDRVEIKISQLIHEGDNLTAEVEIFNPSDKVVNLKDIRGSLLSSSAGKNAPVVFENSFKRRFKGHRVSLAENSSQRIEMKYAVRGSSVDHLRIEIAGTEVRLPLF